MHQFCYCRESNDKCISSFKKDKTLSIERRFSVVFSKRLFIIVALRYRINPDLLDSCIRRWRYTPPVRAGLDNNWKPDQRRRPLDAHSKD